MNDAPLARHREESMNSVRPPKQHRSQETLARFLSATQSLLEEKHFDNISVSEIAGRAGSSVGAFYARFPDKEALLACLQDAFVRDTEREVLGLAKSRDWDAAPLEAVVRQRVGVVVEQHRRHRGTLRALVGRRIAGHTATGPGDRPDADASSARFLEYLIARRREISHPNPDVAVHLGFAMVMGAVRERILFPELSAGKALAASMADAVLVEELSRAFLIFLGVNTAERSR
jgi:AcrR family transcriptional regulator